MSDLFVNGAGRDLVINREHLSYITPKKSALMLVGMMEEEFSAGPGPHTVFVTCGGFGGDAVAIALNTAFRGYICEIDPVVYSGLVHNFREYEGEIPNKWELVNREAIEELRRVINQGLHIDILLVDPPFGPEYRGEARYEPSLRGQTVSDIVVEFSSIPLIIFKLPRHRFDIDKFESRLGDRDCIFYEPEDIPRRYPGNHKFSVLICKKK